MAWTLQLSQGRVNTEFLNQLKPPYERDSGRKNKDRGDETNWAILHIYMEMPHGNSLCSYLKQTKCHFILLLFLYKIREQEGRIGLALAGEWY
jgi:hypothetical protein